MLANSNNHSFTLGITSSLPDSTTKDAGDSGKNYRSADITFTNGRVSSVKARKNQSLLEHMVSMDEVLKLAGGDGSGRVQR